MKKIRKISSLRIGSRKADIDPFTSAEAYTLIRQRHSEVVNALNMVIHHPRSLARPTPTWRPPSKTLPALPGTGRLTAAITRHRVGPRVRARMHGFDPTAQPAYLVSVRITSPTGEPISPHIVEGWMRNLVGEGNAQCVHAFNEHNSPTFLWMVDGQYKPIHSPASLFENSSKAA